VELRELPAFAFLTMNLLTTSIGRLRLVGFLEGVSFLVLLGVAMPLKYYWGEPAAVRVVGMAHGVLFLAYLAATAQAMLDHGWTLKRAMLVAAASLVPFGTFYADVKWMRTETPVR
jgi:integral membrane protein